jgi:hypothetical protein
VVGLPKRDAPLWSCLIGPLQLLISTVDVSALERSLHKDKAVDLLDPIVVDISHRIISVSSSLLLCDTSDLQHFSRPKYPSEILCSFDLLRGTFAAYNVLLDRH